MTQDERWNIRYQEVVSFVRTPGQIRVSREFDGREAAWND